MRFLVCYLCYRLRLQLCWERFVKSSHIEYHLVSGLLQRIIITYFAIAVVVQR